MVISHLRHLVTGLLGSSLRHYVAGGEGRLLFGFSLLDARLKLQFFFGEPPQG